MALNRDEPLLFLSSIDDSLVRWETTRLSREFTASSVAKLEKKLWGGFSEPALLDLRRVCYSRFYPKDAQARAAWALARWAYVAGLYEEALKYVAFMRGVDVAKRGHKAANLLEIELLCRLGLLKEALALVRDRRMKASSDVDFILAHCNVLHKLGGSWGASIDGSRLALINGVLTSAGLASLRKRDEGEPLSIFNLDANPGYEVQESAKVSVIMPVYNAEATIACALGSVLRQTWSNLEVIVVDDCSSDKTFDVTTELASHDQRVRLIRHDRNRGAYSARNTALRYATGDVITCHDGDDWSHPQKLERQIRFLQGSEGCKATISHWVRATSELVFRGTSRPGGKYMQLNHSSLMFTRDVFKAVGSWDEVRVGADTELIWRIERIFGEGAIAHILEDVPLSLALALDASLTRASETNVRTIDYGLRREYREAARYWHRHCSDVHHLKLEPGSARAFPAPLKNMPSPPLVADLDVLIVAAFNIAGGAFVSTMNYIRAALAAGFRVGIFHWGRYDLDVTKPIADEVRRLAHEGQVHIVCPGESVRAQHVIVAYPPILAVVPDQVPKVELENLLVVVNQMPYRLLPGLDIQYDPIECRRNLRRVFGTEGTWAPISGRVRELMTRDGRFPATTQIDWTPLLDVHEWLRNSEGAPERRRASHSRPVVGRHGRDHYTKWPSDPEALASAYCAASNFDVRILGGGRVPKSILGGIPNNWTVSDFSGGESVVRSFLLDLDVFVHYTHPDYIEEFGRCVIEAMACRVPVVLPPVFESTFGPAALYSEPKGVPELVQRLCRDREWYDERVRRGVDFVRSCCDLASFPGRIGVV